MDVIEQLVTMRLDLGLTQRDVAERMGITQATMSGIENGKGSPRFSTIQRYARALGAQLHVVVIPTLRITSSTESTAEQ